MDRAELAEQARELYLDKVMTVHEVAAELRVSYGKAYALLKEADTPMRRRGVSPKKEI